MKFRQGTREHNILKAIPKRLKYISRDDKGDLWVTEKRPMLFETTDKKQKNILELPQPVTFTNTYSLAVFNHLFNKIKNLDIYEVKNIV